ncbi:Pentatricopeptide repeat [Venturia nashicola]|uniref:Pentatricopeptide repeat n=1 Tax=Venturia nashicola TaxID=86259 RepID=A0A4Z1NJE7_9PEZI|nr:Pentatricopeptide repeat [Venturia nashicola]TLD22640.1 Pentatricopeptide repeat [Venturia nashicola]
MDNFFITALVRAGTCSAHSTWKTTRKTSSIPKALHKARRKPSSGGHTSRQFSSKELDEDVDAPIAEPQLPRQQLSKEELRGLVDIYGEFKRQFKEKEAEDEPTNEEPMAGPGTVHAGIKDTFYFTDNEARVGLHDNMAIENLVHELRVHLNNRRTPLDVVWEAYHRLPAPRANFLSLRMLRRLLWHMGITKNREEVAMLRYMSIIEDMQAAGRHVSVKDWNTGISLVGRSMGKITAANVEHSIKIWKDMEKEAGIEGDHVTFSILFDLAVKSEQYVLAEMLEKEALARNLKSDRVYLMAKIYYQGVRGDGMGVRRAYSDMVDAGEIVDTFVLTNVITSLINAGELPAAEMTFERMKRLHASKQGATLPPDDWYEERALQDLLTIAADRFRTDVDGRLNFQEASPVAPNWRTYRAFIQYHTTYSGDYDQVKKLVEDMQEYGIRLNGPIYYCIFHGFLKHGGVRYSRWRLTLLEGFWERYLRGVQDDPDEFFHGHGMALLVLKAFAKCAGRQRASEIWTDLRSRWHPPDKTLRAVNDVLESTAQLEKRPRWER